MKSEVPMYPHGLATASGFSRDPFQLRVLFMSRLVILGEQTLARSKSI